MTKPTYYLNHIIFWLGFILCLPSIVWNGRYGEVMAYYTGCKRNWRKKLGNKEKA